MRINHARQNSKSSDFTTKKRECRKIRINAASWWPSLVQQHFAKVQTKIRQSSLADGEFQSGSENANLDIKKIVRHAGYTPMFVSSTIMAHLFALHSAGWRSCKFYLAKRTEEQFEDSPLADLEAWCGGFVQVEWRSEVCRQIVCFVYELYLRIILLLSCWKGFLASNERLRFSFVCRGQRSTA